LSTTNVDCGLHELCNEQNCNKKQLSIPKKIVPSKTNINHGGHELCIGQNHTRHRIDILSKLDMGYLGESILGWYHEEPPQGMVKEPKMTKSLS